MSGQLRVAFNSNMPAATVEVVSPDMEVVQRFTLNGGRSRSVEVPSEASFLRVHLSSGQIVTLQDPGNLNREVSMEDILAGRSVKSRGGLPGFDVSASPPSLSLENIDPTESPTPSELRRYHRMRSTAPPSTVSAGADLPLAQFAMARLLGADGQALEGMSTSRSREAHWEVDTSPNRPPYQLRIAQSSGSVLVVQVPGNARSVWARADMLHEQSTVSLSVRIQTRSDAADAIANYLHRGDLYSAEAMVEWCDEAIDLLQDKIEDPYAAVVGAYLLLKLRKFSKMRDWGKNLANWFPFLPDGCVVWATQLMQQPAANPAEIRQYLLDAVSRGVPVYTEGLRLLTDGLRLMGDEGNEAREQVRAATGVVVWDSPITGSVQTPASYVRERDRPSVAYDIAFAARA